MTKLTTLTTLTALIEDHEGREASIYTCTAGKRSIAVGWNLDDVPLPDQVIDLMRDIAISRAQDACADIFGAAFTSAGKPRQAALTSLAFMGEGKLRGFVKLRAAVARGDWEAAAAEAQDSAWARQVQPRRVAHVVGILRTGEWP